MPKVKRKLIENEIKGAKPKDKAYKLYDEGGLLLLVRPSGTKVWQYPYKYNDKYNVFTIGKYGDVGSAEARRKRDEIKSLLKEGIDPSQNKKDEVIHRKDEAKNTFEIFAREWYSKQSWVPNHAKKVMSRLEKDVFTVIGRKPITEITTRDIITVLKNIEARGALDVAKRINQYCTAVFDYVISMGICDNNPASGCSKFVKTYEPQNRAHLTEDELPEFLENLNSANHLSLTILATKLLWLTFLRPSELRFAQWNEISEKKALWTVPAARMKKKKNVKREDHLVPLSLQALDVIRQIRNISGDGEILFPGQKRINQPISDVAFIKTVKKLSDNKSTPHGVRHLFSTIANEHGHNKDHIERQLDHVEKNKVRGIYNKALYLEDRKKLMQWWADYLDRV